MGVILACAILCTALRPIVRVMDDVRQSDERARTYMALGRVQLYQRLATGDPAEAYWSAWALHSKGLLARDRQVLAAAFVDRKLPVSTRRDMGAFLTYCPPPFPDEILAVVARELDSTDSESQVMAAEILSKIAPDAPTKFEVTLRQAGRGWTSDWEEYRANVDLFRRWWQERQTSEAIANEALSSGRP